jgi:oxalate decarboxylase/phosphoglucose isomerase-like protein (cupin superfamily)
MDADTVTLAVVAVKHETAAAILVETDDGTVCWVPKSAIHDDSECYSLKSGPGDLIVARWWAEKEGVEP